ncbi:hypothetical protein Ctob_006450 [Chrysochromulina tobinii]|jgi:hypothetical protein|uniref:Uncharacterized protein n=1 Tax=Chrysochromulina tobinii TaxID=1460289 RepID=A0A0M0JZ14_9EUKA|nr:hypothetical protein Ctob_006450 [Chrysochromulina tobinii]|eukprot:KOO31800.1 hypothetical protein Ctob_006450 [Chrysochromulina sp. CCMP291]
MTTLTSIDANLDRVVLLEQQTTSARATVHEALVNLLQSRAELSGPGSSAGLSAATRAAMGKRGIAQLEACKGMLDAASDTAALVKADATKLRNEVRAAVNERDEAQRRAVAAHATQQETCARVEAEGHAQMIATNEVVDQARRAAAAADRRAEATALRAEQAERGFKEAQTARLAAEEALRAANGARDQAEALLSTAAAQLSREREVLAKLMAENVLFVRKVEYAEAERTRALEEKEALRTAWRTQMEEWFARAASEMQTKLISDWGAADGLLTELSRVRKESEAAEHASAAKCASLGAAEDAAREAAALLSAQHEAANAELATTRSELETARSELETARRLERVLVAEAEVRQKQLEELKAAEASWRERGEADMAARLALRAAHAESEREAAHLKEQLEATEDRLRLQRTVNERMRAEASEEHSRLLEAQAKLEHLEESMTLISRQNSVLLRSAEQYAQTAA